MLVSPIQDSNQPVSSSSDAAIPVDSTTKPISASTICQGDVVLVAPTKTEVAPREVRILVAEDNSPTRNFLQIFLTRAGYKVDIATNGVEAWNFLTARDPKPGTHQSEEITQSEYDIIISDWSMPQCDGMELVRRIRNHPRHCRVYLILVTANATVENVVNGLDNGADEYIAKPFQPEELLARIKVGLRIRRLQDELANMEHKLAVMHLATSANHEINNPLMVLMGNLELLRKRVAPLQDHEIFKRLDAILKAAERIQRVAAELKNLKNVKLTSYMRDVKMIDLSGKDSSQ